MNRRYICALLLCAVMLCLTGCRAEAGVKVRFRDLPAEQQVYLLLRTEQNDFDPNAKLPDTEIAAYESEGWIAVLPGRFRHAEASAGKLTDESFLWLTCGSVNDDSFRALCEKYRSFRLAFTDENGNVQSVTDEITLCPAGKAGYPREMDYICADGTVQITSWYAQKWHGRTPEGWHWLLIGISWLMLIPLLGISAAIQTNGSDKRKKRRAEAVTVLICALPAIASIVVGLIIQFTPRLNLSDSPFDSSALLLLTVPVFPWIIALVILPVWLAATRPGRQKTGGDNTS